MLKVLFNDNFRKEFLDICDYIEEFFGLSYIESFRLRLDKKIINLSLFPEMGRPTSDKKIYFINCGKNKIFYSFKEGELQLRHIIDNRRLSKFKK